MGPPGVFSMVFYNDDSDDRHDRDCDDQDDHHDDDGDREDSDDDGMSMLE